MVSIGGGYASIPLIQETIVGVHGWIDTQTFIDIITISQMTPGPLSVNLSTFVGMKHSGIPGAIVATLGSVIVGVLLSSSVYQLYLKYKDRDVVATIMQSLRVSSVALIANAAFVVMSLLLIGEAGFDYKALLIFGVCIVLIKKFNFKLAPILLISALMGVII